MAREFTMPKLGLTMTDGTIREWLVEDGAVVQVGEPVLIIETDKVETEVEAREAGILHPTGAVGENFECGAVIGWLHDADEAAAPPAEPQASAAEPSPAAATPTTASAPVSAGPAASPAPEPIAPAAAGLAAVAARGEHNRILASPRARAAALDRGIDLGSVSGTGPAGRIVFDDIAAYLPPSASPAANGELATRGEHERILASPRARAAAADRGLDLAAIGGSGPGGRIVFDDVDAFVAAPPAAAAADAPEASVPPAPAAAPSAGTPASPTGSAVLATAGARLLGELLGLDLAEVPSSAPDQRITREDVAAWVRSRLAGPSADAQATSPGTSDAPLLQAPSSIVPFRGMRRVIAERMHMSLSTMAQLTLSVDADMAAISAEREQRRSAGQVVPGYTAWVVAAAARALVDHPIVNSQVTADGVALLPNVNVGVAVALDDGLIVPVVDGANHRSVEDTHGRVADLATRARSGKLQLDELSGGTFSVTALGMYGVDMFTPVINPPNTAILGVGRLRTDTAWTDDGPRPATVMTLSLTWDHRAFDGAPAAEFAQTVVRYLENPDRLDES